MKLILITGTPGVGKTVTCRFVKKRLKIPFIDLNQLALNKNLTLGYDKKRNCSIADFDTISKEVLEEIRQLKSETVILDGHYAVQVVNTEMIKIAFVLRCDPNVLENRLRKRGYSERKIAENIMAEILGVCLNDVFNYFDPKKVYQIDATKLSPLKVATKIIDKLENKTLKSEVIDWMEKIIEDGNIKLLFKYEKILSATS